MLLFVFSHSCADVSSKQFEWRDWKRLCCGCGCFQLVLNLCGGVHANLQSNVRFCFESLDWHSPVVLLSYSYLCVEFESSDSQVHPCEALVSSDGVNLNELVLPYGWAHRSVRLVVVQVESFLQNKYGVISTARLFIILQNQRYVGTISPCFAKAKILM